MCSSLTRFTTAAGRLNGARNALAELGAAAVLMAVIHYKPGANATGYEPDFYVETMNGWVHYPWEPIDSLGSVYQAALRGQAR